MNGVQWMVVLIVAIVMVTSLLKARHGRRGTSPENDAQERLENERLREEVKLLKERLQVLERITVEKENTLSRDIEELRDR